MLTQVPTAVNRASRLVTLRHPNAMDCTVWRKTVNRTSTVSPTTAPDGTATIEGVGVLGSEEEADYTYTEIGDGKALFCGQFQTAGNNVMDDQAGLNYNEPPVEALIESLIESGPGSFAVQKDDVVTCEPGAGIVLSYMVAHLTSPTLIPPHAFKYVLVPMQDFERGL